MKTSNELVGCTRWWWLILCVGILTALCGLAYFFWPVAGYAVASQIFGWLLIMAGIVELCVAAGPNYPKGWGWWIVGGIINMFIGFMMVRSVLLSEAVLPYFLAFIFLYWGITSFVNAFTGRKLWWLYIVNGILMMVIGYFFIEEGWVGNMMSISFLTALAFGYWGISIAVFSYDMRPVKEK